MRFFHIFLVALLLSACAGTVEYSAPKQQFSLSDRYFKDKTTVEDGALDTIVTFTTKPGFVHNYGTAAGLTVDTFLRGYINKETRQREFEVYQLVKYADRDRRHYRTARYETPDGVRSIGVTEFWSRVDCPPGGKGGCIYEEHIGFSVGQNLLQRIAGSYGPGGGQAAGWTMRFIPVSGKQFQTLITAAEVKGLLDRMDEYEREVMDVDRSGQEI